MANHCTTDVTLKGSTENLNKLYIKLQGLGRLTLSEYPKIFDNQLDVDKIDWGSKWQEIHELDYCVGGDTMYVYGISAWCPTKGLWSKVSKDYNLNVTLRYHEETENFGGYVIFNDGNIIDEMETTYYEYLYNEDVYAFWDSMEYLLGFESFEDVVSIIGGVYEIMNPNEKERLNSMSNDFEI